MDLWELVARERIRDALARYSWSGDAARLDDLAQCFCEDGELELRGGEPVRGRAAIVELLGGVVAAPNATAEASKVRTRHESPATSRSSARSASTTSAAIAMSSYPSATTG